MTPAFGKSAYDMMAPAYRYTAFDPLGGVFVLGVGMLVLGIPLLTATTEAVVTDDSLERA